jgi:hypothetical protein
MSAAQALSAARAVGIHLEVDGDDLVLEAPAPPPSAILEVLSQHKAEIVAMLRPGPDGWSADESFRWPPMVFRVPIHEPSSLRFMEATGCSILCVATEMEAAGRLHIAIHGPRRQGSSGRGYDQIEALLSWWLRP